MNDDLRIRRWCEDKFGRFASFQPIELVAVSDIADRAGVQPQTVSNWIARYDEFPRPVTVVARGEVRLFDWSEVDSWMNQRRKWERRHG